MKGLSVVPPRRLAAAIAVVSVAAAVVVGISAGLELSILVLSAGVLILVIGLFWLSVRNLAGETPLTLDEALGLGAPSTEEEQKRAVLRALKDLEFERSVGKIGEQDYLEFSARYRAEAKRLIASIDESLDPVKKLAEKLAAERFAAAGLSDSLPAASPARTSAEVASRPCTSCQMANDPDARFCKHCGAALEAPRRSATSATSQTEEEVS